MTGVAVDGVERVLVVPRSAVMADPGWHGVRTDGVAGFEKLVRAAGRFEPRPAMERARDWN